MNKIKVISLVFLVVIGLTIFGCQAKAEDPYHKVSLDGSTSMEKLMNALREGVNEEYPSLQLEPQFTGSSSGIEAVLQHRADIGNSSRALKASEKKKGLVENIVAIDAIAVITSKDNPVNNLTRQQLIDIYKGKIRNWQEVGGNNQPIVVIGREAGSGTRVAFEELLKIEEQCQYANEYNETGPVMAKVGSISGAIGYVSLDVLDESVKALSIDNVEVNQESIQSGKYLLQRPFVMATYGPIEKQRKEVQDVFYYLQSPKGQKIIQSVGLMSPQ
ncbi:phosphate ABC transporter substrate-binding protein [Longibaculum muris]|uniref:phosphate ABC transporter substrate-binding protein n=1 Tax=Longibaculum muris TaxID=1796628 RepID=UPI0022E2FB85|nr:phosphate ABC transporter substrate-binding protein [Longibaculum muris]